MIGDRPNSLDLSTVWALGLGSFLCIRYIGGLGPGEREARFVFLSLLEGEGRRFRRIATKVKKSLSPSEVHAAGIDAARRALFGARILLG